MRETFGSGGQESEACFGCMNSKCKARQGSKTETTPSSMAIQAISALLPPILGFIAGFFLTALAFPGSGDPARSAGGALLMILSALAVYLYRRKNPVNTSPKVVQIWRDNR
jgi:sigma-E factor negative regulatory protein RseC